MKNSLLILLLSAACSYAQPSGKFSYEPAVNIWDFTGQYEESWGDSFIELDIRHLVNGKILGTIYEQRSEWPTDITGQGAIKGIVINDWMGVGVAATWKGQFAGSYYDYSVTGSASGAFKGYVSSFATVPIINKTQYRARGWDSQTSIESYEFDLETEGGWTLQLDILSKGNKILGVAEIVLENGRTLNYQVSGSYQPKTSTSTLRLKGLLDASGSSFILVTSGNDMRLVKLTGNLLGQKIRL